MPMPERLNFQNVSGTISLEIKREFAFIFSLVGRTGGRRRGLFLRFYFVTDFSSAWSKFKKRPALIFNDTLVPASPRGQEQTPLGVGVRTSD